jgi:hypothetical protein
MMLIRSSANALLLSLLTASQFWPIQQSNAYVAAPPVSMAFLRQFIPRGTGGVSDTTNIGSLVVPTIGTGTISWSSESSKYFPEEIQQKVTLF